MDTKEDGEDGPWDVLTVGGDPFIPSLKPPPQPPPSVHHISIDSYKQKALQDPFYPQYSLPVVQYIRIDSGSQQIFQDFFSIRAKWPKRIMRKNLQQLKLQQSKYSTVALYCQTSNVSFGAHSTSLLNPQPSNYSQDGPFVKTVKTATQDITLILHNVRKYSDADYNNIASLSIQYCKKNVDVIMLNEKPY